MAAIGVIFNDETVLSIGANSELAVNEYVFNPDQGRFSFVVKMVTMLTRFSVPDKVCPNCASKVLASVWREGDHDTVNPVLQGAVGHDAH